MLAVVGITNRPAPIDLSGLNIAAKDQRLGLGIRTQTFSGIDQNNLVPSVLVKPYLQSLLFVHR